MSVMRKDLRERNARIFEGLVRGGTLTAVSFAEGIGKERARQILKRMGRMMLRSEIIKGCAVPNIDISFYGVRDFRSNPDFWISQLEKWKFDNLTGE
jgi:cytosine/adenosine deaminase-related metal-dependent hydrolase